MTYRHGAYGEIVPSQEKTTSGQGTIPFYVGSAPIFRVQNYTDKINNPILIRSLEDAQAKLGYRDTDNFKNFTLSSVVYAHFRNKVEAIGPVVVVNVLDPKKHINEGLTASINLINKVGYIDDCVILDSIKISDFIKDTDFKVEYDVDGRVKLSIINPEITSPVTVEYKKIDTSSITEEDIIGTYDSNTDLRTGIQCIETIYEDLNIIPNVLAAPGWSQKTLVEQALVSAAEKYDEHYDAIVNADIDSYIAKTIDSALEWKKTNNYNSKLEKLCWPRAKIGDRDIWMSVIAAVRMQQTDTKNKGIPFESPSNKEIDINGLVVGENDRIKLNSVQGNKLNEKGITTALSRGGKWVLWGPHMANYDYISTDKPEDIFDVNTRMNIYLSNNFQVRNASLVDSPIARNDLDGILNSEQIRLDSLVSDGKLLYGKIEFISSSNQTSDLIQGNFKFDTQVTSTPPGKSLLNRIQYTSKGIDTLVGGEE